jgi:hypothetical protein
MTDKDIEELLTELDNERNKNDALYKTCERLTDENKELCTTIHLLEVDLAAMTYARDTVNLRLRDLRISLPLVFGDIVDRIAAYKQRLNWPGVFDNEAEKKGDSNER